MYEEQKRKLGAAIRRKREAESISQRRFALMTSMSRSYLWKVESGSADIGIELLCKISEALDSDVREFIDF